MSGPITSAELSQSLARGGVGPLYAVVGEEDYLRDRAIDTLRLAALGAEADSGFNYDVFYGDEAAAADVVTCAAEMPVFALRRVIIYKSADKISAREGEKLSAYFAEPNETTTLVIAGVKLDGRLKWTQALTKRATMVQCAPLRDAQLAAWITREASALGVALQEEAVQALKDSGGESLYALRRELEKLASYVPAGQPASAADVEQLRGTEPGASVFDLLTAIGARRHGRALQILARNVENGEAPLRILGALVWQYRRLWKIKEQLKAGGREGEAARTLRMDPSRVRGFLGAFSDAQLAQALHWFMETDSKLKGGSGTAPVRVMEALLFRLCGTPATPTQATPRREPSRVSPPRAAGARSVSNIRTVRWTR